jgi:hypothetical protein
MALVVPLLAVADQTLLTQLSEQSVKLRVRQLRYGLFVDVYVDSGSTLVIGGVIGRDRNRIVRSSYLNFVGDFSFFDTQGTDDPEYSGLGVRWQLVYLLPSELSLVP